MEYLMKCMAVLGLVFFLLSGSFASANDLRLGKENAAAHPHIDGREKDLGRSEPFSNKAITEKDVDVAGKDIGQGEPLRKEGTATKDVDLKGIDLGEGEPFIKAAPTPGGQVSPQDPGFSVNELSQTGAAEKLVGSDFTDAIVAGSIGEKPFLRSMSLLSESDNGASEIESIQGAEGFNVGLNQPEEGFQTKKEGLVPNSSGETVPLAEAGALIPIITVVPVP